jgi:prepilin-type N-terminal cleavage/methylation domain-containing protein
MFCIKEYRSTRGFTLIELMIAIAIVAVLISLAVPLYSGYRIRAKVTECIDGATVAKFAISEYRMYYG